MTFENINIIHIQKLNQINENERASETNELTAFQMNTMSHLRKQDRKKLVSDPIG